ncbi:MAG: heme-binding protein, partial [Parvularculaceae bacterium]|nr:heme-binding protein [Parvularculaceae bacterium]
PPPPPRLNAEQAQQIIGGCAAHAKAKKQSHAIAVTDGGGHLIAFWRMDGNTAGVGAFSIDKAKAVSLWGFPTSRMGAAADETPGFASAPGIVTVAGGVPIYSADGETHLGGVGVSGEAPEDDAACAVAGIEAAGLRAERVRSPTGGR